MDRTPVSQVESRAGGESGILWGLKRKLLSHSEIAHETRINTGFGACSFRARKTFCVDLMRACTSILDSMDRRI